VKAGEWVRVTLQSPCPYCERADERCAVSKDGQQRICYRVGGAEAREKRDKAGVLYYAYAVNPLANGHTNGHAGNGKPIKPAGKTPGLADPARLDEVYRALLDRLVLSPAHRVDLERRGFPEGEADRLLYRSMPARGREQIAHELAGRFGRDVLLHVPGFFINDRRSLSIASLPGLLIPVRAVRGRIGALIIRPNEKLDDGGKYLWVSSKNRGGPGPGALPHIPLGVAGPARTARLTEGQLKADLATILSGIPTVGAPGVGNWRCCLSVLKALGAKTVRLAFDADWRTKPHVAQALVECGRTLVEAGFALELELWPESDGKGIDDLLAGGKTPEVLAGEKALAALAEVAGSAPPQGPEANGRDRGDRLNRTDLGNARRLVRGFGDDIRYCYQWGKWLIWDGARWKEDATGYIFRLARKTVQAIGAEAAAIDDEAERKALLKWALTSENKKQIDAMIALAQSEPGIPIEPAALDRDRNLLNVENGTVDLHTGELQPHRREDLITKLAPVRYDRDASCPRFRGFLGRIMEADRELIGFLKRAAGYALTGDIGEHCLFFLHGGGRNGKSTFLGVIQGILGSYATTINATVLTSKLHNDHPTELCDLDGPRFVTTIEVEDGKRMAEALVKSLTGGDPIKARRMRRDPYQFDPKFKLFVAANHKPEIRGTDEGIWSRIKLIPFGVTIPKEERIRNLADRLCEEEGPGILNWLIEGCLEWRAGGLAEPGVVTNATAEYRAEMDAIGDFIAERCLTNPGVRCKNNELYMAYKAWCERAGVDHQSLRKFGGEMEKRGFKHRDSNGTRWRLGIGIAQDGREVDEGNAPF
jgi:putative DNA primase/helicase